MFSPIPHGWPVTSTITASVYLFRMYYRFLNFYSKYFFAKTFNNVGFDLRGEIVATTKCSIPYSCHTIWNIDTSERATVLKNTIIYICHTIWNIDASERTTIEIFTLF